MKNQKTLLSLLSLLPREFSPIATVKVIDNIEVTVQQEVDEGGNIYEPLLQVFAMFPTRDDPESEYFEVWLQYEGEIWGWQPL